MRHCSSFRDGVVAALDRHGRSGVRATARARRRRSAAASPGTETPYILVTAFHAPTKQLAVEAADELRSRLPSEHSAKELFVITKATVEATLRASGYPVDSALSVADLMELGKALRAEYVDRRNGEEAGTGNAVRFETAVLIKTGQQVLTQPLPGVDGKDLGDAAKLRRARDHRSDQADAAYRDCIAALRAREVRRRGRESAHWESPPTRTAAFARICLLNAYSSAKAPPDSIIGLANQILAIDSTSMLALANLAEAYDAKGDKAKATETTANAGARAEQRAVSQGSSIDDSRRSDPTKALG